MEKTIKVYDINTDKPEPGEALIYSISGTMMFDTLTGDMEIDEHFINNLKQNGGKYVLFEDFINLFT